MSFMKWLKEHDGEGSQVFVSLQSLDKLSLPLDNDESREHALFSTPKGRSEFRHSSVSLELESGYTDTPIFVTPPDSGALEGTNLFLVAGFEESKTLSAKACCLGATISDSFCSNLTHLIVANFPTGDPDQVLPKLDSILVSLDTKLELSPASFEHPLVGLAIVANFRDPDTSQRCKAYVVSSGWLEDALLLNYRPSEACYISASFCKIRLGSIQNAMSGILRLSEGLNEQQTNKNYLDHNSDASTCTASDEKSKEEEYSSFLEMERCIPLAKLPLPKVGDMVESKSAHIDAQIFKARVLERWICDGTWVLRLKSSDLGAAYNEPLKNVRMNNAWSTAQLLDICQGRRTRKLRKLPDNNSSKKRLLSQESLASNRCGSSGNAPLLPRKSYQLASNLESASKSLSPVKASVCLLPLTSPDIKSDITDKLLSIAAIMDPSKFPCSPNLHSNIDSFGVYS